MADAKPAETPAPSVAAPAPAPEAPTAHVQAIRTAIADMEKMAADAAGKGDQATVERLRSIAVPLAKAGRAPA